MALNHVHVGVREPDVNLGRDRREVDDVAVVPAGIEIDRDPLAIVPYRGPIGAVTDDLSVDLGELGRLRIVVAQPWREVAVARVEGHLPLVPVAGVSGPGEDRRDDIVAGALSRPQDGADT